MLLKIAALLLISTSLVSSFSLSRKWSKLIDYDLWHENLKKLELAHNQCVFFRGESGMGKLACYDKVKESLIECPAHSMFEGVNEAMFHSFSIGLVRNETNSSSSSNATVENNSPLANVNLTSVHLLDLYPKPFESAMDNMYMDSYVNLHGTATRFGLFHSHDANAIGVHIIDSKCFARLVKFFADLKHFDNMHLCSFSSQQFNASRLAELYII
jgi:hypothetical protein